MNTIDLVLLAIIGVSALLGTLRGFVGVVASAVTWVGAGWVAFHHGADLAFWFSDDGQPGATDLLGGYVAAFVGVVVVVSLVSWSLRRVLHSIGLSGVDRMLGFAIGTLRGGFIACVVVLLMAFSTLPREPSWKESALLPLLTPGAQWMSLWLPEWAAGQLDFGNGAAAGDNGASHLAGAMIGTIVDGLPSPLEGDEPTTTGDETEPSPPNPGQ
ncbi:CvpA family protein [Xanthomonas sp. XNM01]|uniref:CvpA family protein n=1 Tax=Xanthomonas sp. XNM01 TaxID=2769289 RepID=UPI001783D38D|nr:CvpA family protein [Xanthomonas sp. XNM01]MBD9369261.1 CvpA family protein [Xanthomonas sp. XNM01]